MNNELIKTVLNIKEDSLKITGKLNENAELDVYREKYFTKILKDNSITPEKTDISYLSKKALPYEAKMSDEDRKKLFMDVSKNKEDFWERFHTHWDVSVKQERANQNVETVRQDNHNKVNDLAKEMNAGRNAAKEKEPEESKEEDKGESKGESSKDEKPSNPQPVDKEENKKPEPTAKKADTFDMSFKKTSPAKDLRDLSNFIDEQKTTKLENENAESFMALDKISDILSSLTTLGGNK